MSTSASTYLTPQTINSPLAEPCDASLLSRLQVATASLLGGPLAGFVLLGVNFRRLGRPGAAVGSVLVGLVMTALLILTGYFNPNNLASLGGAISRVVAAFYMWLVIDTVQGLDLNAHFRLGGDVASCWSAVGLGFSVALAQAMAL